MPAVESPAGLNVLVVADGQTGSEATCNALDKLGWRPWQLAVADLMRGDVVSRPPDAAIVTTFDSVADTIHAVQRLVSEAPGVPIVVLTDDLAAAEQALFAGATATLPSAARTSLLHAQLRAALRQTPAMKQVSEATGLIRVRALKVDTLRCEVTVNNRRLDLTPTEYRVLSTLVRYAGRALGADFLLQQSSGLELSPTGAREIVKVHVARLRRKIEDATGEPDYIANVRNVGYLLDRRRRSSRKG